MANKFQFPLGAKVRCAVTGLEGIIISAAEHISGCRTYGVQGPAKDGVIPRAHSILETRLQLLSAPRKGSEEPYRDFKYPLGLKAEDVVTGFKGVLTVRSHALGAVDSYWIDAAHNKEGKRVDDCFDENRIKVSGRRPVLSEPPANALVG